MFLNLKCRILFHTHFDHRWFLVGSCFPDEQKVSLQHIILQLNIHILGDYVSTFEVKGKKCLSVEPEALTLISEQAMIDVAHLLRPAHLQVKIIM